MPEIGATLREARMRARIDVSEIEAKTKIRAKYLRALENEEWSLLPGPTFVKSFLRTYAQALGLDGKALVEEYRMNHERPSDLYEPIVAPPRRRGGISPGPSRTYTAAVAAVVLVIVVLIVLLATGGGGGTRSAARRTGAHRSHHPRPTAARSAPRPSPIVTLSLKATATVYVCLLGDDGRKLIAGAELPPGESTPTFHARRFLLTLGNSSVTMYVDGRPRSVPPSSEPIGYSITKARGRQPLAPSELPTCR